MYFDRDNDFFLTERQLSAISWVRDIHIYSFRSRNDRDELIYKLMTSFLNISPYFFFIKKA